jgi:hypothetical protein
MLAEGGRRICREGAEMPVGQAPLRVRRSVDALLPYLDVSRILTEAGHGITYDAGAHLTPSGRRST